MASQKVQVSAIASLRVCVAVRVIVRIMFRFNKPDTMNLIRWLPDVDLF